MATSPLTGLTSSEVAERIRSGLVNRSPRSELRDYAQILARNLFTWFNAMVVPAAIALLYLREFQGGIAVSGMAIVNTAIALIQEFRAKIHLDKLAILVETKARVLRDGNTQSIPAGDVVQGETVLIETGETIVADGPVLESHFLEIDEALLTGESDPVRRREGDRLLSGSFCVAGNGAFRAENLGRSAFANDTSAQARRYHYVPSPMTRVINLLVQILSYTAVALIVLYTIAYVMEGFPKTLEQERDFVRMIAATITSLVPQGMVLTATVSFTVGAVHMSRRGAVVQRLNAVEAMASIDVICTDKTGTLTTNQLRLEKVHIIEPDAQARDIPCLRVGLTEKEIRRRLQLFGWASVDQQNKNIQALRQALGRADAVVLDQIPFKSQNRYSAVRLKDQDVERVLVLGAFEALQKRIETSGSAPADLAATIRRLQETGRRILLFGEMDSSEVRAFPTEQPVLPDGALHPLALVCLGDELRPDAGQVLEALYAQGITFKVISGDNPETVRATVSHLNLPLARDPVISGDELAQANNADELIRSRSVFGRVSPLQKLAIIESLKRQGFQVAMIGDGVNDVLPIKRADLGIAMGEGSQASKTVAGLILENNNFALLPETLAEGRTIVRNLRRSSKLFLVKNVYSLVLILVCATGLVGVRFPYLPQQVTLLNWLVIGIPAFVIALSRERTPSATKPRFLREVGSFALRTGLLFGLAGLAVLWIDHQRGADHMHARTMLLTTLILLGITALFRALRDGETADSGTDRRLRLLACLAVPVYMSAMYWPMSASFFQLAPLTRGDWLMATALAATTYVASRVSDLSMRIGSFNVPSS